MNLKLIKWISSQGFKDITEKKINLLLNEVIDDLYVRTNPIWQTIVDTTKENNIPKSNKHSVVFPASYYLTKTEIKDMIQKNLENANRLNSLKLNNQTIEAKKVFYKTPEHIPYEYHIGNVRQIFTKSISKPITRTKKNRSKSPPTVATKSPPTVATKSPPPVATKSPGKESDVDDIFDTIKSPSPSVDSLADASSSLGHTTVSFP